MKSCVCCGLIPTCKKCGGTGFATGKVSTSAPNIAIQKRRSQQPVVHPKIAKQTTIRRDGIEFATCSVCGVRVRSDRLQRHLKKIHRLPSDPASTTFVDLKAKSTMVKLIKKKPLSQKNKESGVVSKSQSESSFADKNLGYFARDKGQFGSLPLYDDYSEESDAN